MSLEAKLAILEQIARYSHTFDGCDVDAFAAIFSKDGVFEVYAADAVEPELRLVGRAGIQAWVSDWYQNLEPGRRSRHYQTNTLFHTLTDESAETSTMLLLTVQFGDEPQPRVKLTGVYHDRWKRSDGGWLLVYRALSHDRSTPLED
ncbi:nuclear transport factor 2 family protein [Planktothrix mougeotii]|uniref:Nuclear transport factor 2 family protein n=1 Tax=Planktothrix mougeotii LEGE 06226 TaxID=1828728 RepID=A0ABR9UG86_9CYAN|nr:nuclear transport factor 2 family protein [Planktothrix mougeotii]MBE9144826.1 nuclear transport factor 2 family protein [Planktothrix mougeotii LEGE 06226]